MAVFDVQTRRETALIAPAEPFLEAGKYTVSFSRDGHRLGVGFITKTDEDLLVARGGVDVYDTATGDLVANISSHSGFQRFQFAAGIRNNCRQSSGYRNPGKQNSRA